jgi:Tol biopolymer transport system component
MRSTTLIAAIFFVAATVSHTIASAGAFPGANGKIAFFDVSLQDIEVINPDGTGRVKLTTATDDSPAWSPDGTRLAFVRNVVELWVMNADGSGKTKILDGNPNADEDGIGTISWSPDGASIAFDRGTGRASGNDTRIFKMSSTGGGVTQVTQSASSDPAWSPDGTKIALQSPDGLTVINADGTNPTLLTDRSSDAHPNWSPDGTKIAFQRGDNGPQVFVMGADGSGITQLTTGESGGDNPAFSPDGTKIAFDHASDIWTMNPDGSGAVNVTSTPGTTERDPDWGVLVSETPVPPECSPPYKTERVSVASGGTGGNGESLTSAISADGRYVAYWSGASNLVAGDTNEREDVFVHDRSTGATTRVSVASDGTEGEGDSFTSYLSVVSKIPALSADGRFVAFPSAADLASSDTASPQGHDVFMHDRSTGATMHIGAQGPAGRPTISADGRFVAFPSDVHDTSAGPTTLIRDIFVHDRSTAAITKVNVATDGTLADDHSFASAISADGRFVAFESDATNLVADDSNERSDIFVHDRSTGATTRVSVASDGTQARIAAIGGDEGSTQAAISADGRFVAFTSVAGNLVAGDTNSAGDVFVHDRSTGATTRVSVASDGSQAKGSSLNPAISADGRYVAFSSTASNLVVGDTNGNIDIFVHDRSTGATMRINVASDGTEANLGSLVPPSISADGRFVAFTSPASNLVSGDTSNPFSQDVFVGALIARPDAQIKTSGEYVGDDVYQSKRISQKKSLTINRKKSAVFTIAVENDGNIADSYRLKGPGDKPGFSVTYLFRGRDVTRTVVDGRFKLGPLGRCDSETITLKVSAKVGARAGSTASWVVTATSESQTDSKDAVEAIVEMKF